MAFKYSSAFVEAVQDAPVRSLGQELGLLCVQGNLRATYVAQVLNVTRMTVHLWFRGSSISPGKHFTVKALVKILKEDLENGTLPVKTAQAGRAYLQEMSNAPIVTAMRMARKK